MIEIGYSNSKLQYGILFRRSYLQFKTEMTPTLNGIMRCS